MAIIDSLFSFGPLRKAVWQWWYPFLTRRLRDEDVIFLNYAYEQDPPLGIQLNGSDESNRYCAQLYHHVANQADIRGRDVLEISSGHGGGASYLTRAFSPRNYVGIDLNREGIEFCRRRHSVQGLRFEPGDAMELPFPDGTFDCVINVEASHCYPDFAAFLAEVARVLRPDGHFLYADFRFSDGFSSWEAAFERCSMKTVKMRSISEEVLRGMRLNSERSLGLVERHLPRVLYGLGKDFAGVEGSRLYRGLQDGSISYRSYCLQKPAT